MVNVVNARPPSLYFSAIAPGSSGADLYRLGADGSFEAMPVRTGADARPAAAPARTAAMRCSTTGSISSPIPMQGRPVCSRSAPTAA